MHALSDPSNSQAKVLYGQLSAHHAFIGDLILLSLVILSFFSFCALISATAILITKYRIWREQERLEKQSKMTPEQLELIGIKFVSKQDVVDIDGARAHFVCAICLDDINEGDEVRDLPCSHVFHSSCVDSWFLTRHKSCPTCRRDVVQLRTEATTSQPSTSPIISE
jgi:hypothetical protein